MNFVCCNSCKREYETFQRDMDQAYGCAAWVRPDGTILGAYGSTLADMVEFQFISRPDFVKDGMICDECILHLINNDHIKRLDEDC